MPVYSHRMMSDLHYSLDKLAVMFFERMPLVLAPDEFIAAFIAPEHVTTLRQVEELVGHTGGTSARFTVPVDGKCDLKVTVDFGMRPPIILPRYISGGVQPTCPDEVSQKIMHWVNERVDFGYAFGDAADALNALNDVCVDVRAMTAMLPCFTTIMAGISDDSEAKTTKRAQSLNHNKSVGRLPRLPRQVKDRLLEVSAIVSSVSLLKDAPIPETPKEHARFRVDSYSSVARTFRPNIFQAENQVYAHAAFK
jgi:hypothetical protein